MREAVEVSSASLARTVDEVFAGHEGRPAEAALRRAVRAVTRYRIRMATRCTPFGLMAGVAAAEFVDEPAEVKIRLGSDHRRAVRPDREWLTGLVAEWEQRTDVLRHLRVTVNNLCFVRGDRLVLPYLPDTASRELRDPAAHEVSVRHTAAVRAVVAAARRPVPCAELERRLCAAFPAASPDAAAAMLGQLVAKEILLTDLRPPLEETDPLAYVVNRLADLPAPARPPEFARLREVSRGLADYAARALGGGGGVWREVTAGMRRLRGGEQMLQVDLELDADVRLPRAVADEAERAAGLLWRLAPRIDADPMSEYHQAFLERYGTDRLVPLKELLDPDIGLGAPAGYRRPPSHRSPRSGLRRDARRDAVLAAAAEQAILAGEDEVVLTDEADDPVVSRLSRAGDRSLPGSAELCVQVLADSPSMLQDGRFRLVVMGSSPQPGAIFGRFAHLLPDGPRAALGELARTQPTRPGALPVQLTFQAASARSGNVAQVPRLLDHLLPVAAFADPDDSQVVDVDHLVVGADAHRLFIVDRRSGREVVPTVFNMLNPHWNAPNAARFLREVALMNQHGAGWWNWGTADAMPYLPRVRYGRTILAPARWRPSSEVYDQDVPFDQWAAAVRAWQARWNVPRRICASHADHRLELELDDEEHLRLLRHELGRRPQAVVEETFGEGDGTDGWLVGPGGAHRNEVVVPLVARPKDAATGHGGGRRDRAAPPRRAPGEHFPGGEWLYASVYGSPDRQTELLAVEVPALVAALPDDVDRWFFLRYQDGDDHHLRFRFHGSPTTLTGDVLPRLHDWMTGLRRRGLAWRLLLDTYDPEWERYGGPEAMVAAERAFQADSVAVLEQVKLLHGHQLALEPALLAAANHVDLARAFWWPPGPAAAEPAWITWLLGRYPKDNAAHAEFQRRRGEAVDLIDPYGDWAELRAQPGGEALFGAWRERSRAIAAYGCRLHELGERAWAAPTAVLPSLLHMSHNRLIGAGCGHEQASFAVARGAVQAHRDRRRWAR